MLCIKRSFFIGKILLLFIYYFPLDFHPYYVYVFMQGSSNSILLVNWKYLPFYFISPPTSNTFFSPCFLFLSDARNQFFFLFYPPPPPSYFLFSGTHLPPTFYPPKLISDNSRKSGLKLPFLAYYTNVHTNMHWSTHKTHTHRKSYTEEK